jgi:diguanylate cyclase (GGDEF)-like protein
MAALMICCSIRSKRNNKTDNKIGHSIQGIFYIGAAVLIFNATAILIPNKWCSTFFYGLYYGSVDFLLIYFLTYIEYYTKRFTAVPVLKWAAYMIAAADTLVMIINSFTGIIFTCSQKGAGNGIFFVISNRTVFYNVHLYFNYLIVCAVFVSLVSAITTSPKIYRTKYLPVLIIFIAVIAGNLLYHLAGTDFDYSLVTYAFLAFVIFYYSLVYVPRDLVRNMLSFVISNMTDGVICYDNEGNCIYANDTAKFMLDSNDSFESFEDYYEQWAEQSDFKHKKSSSRSKTYIIYGEKKSYEEHYKRLEDEGGKYIGCFILIHDNTDEVQKLEAERYCATHDMLTGTYNKEYFFRKVHEAISANPNETFLIVYADIKNFKLINDVFGVDKGDDLLRAISAELEWMCGTKTIYGRLSGDKFALCMLKDKFEEEVFLCAADKIAQLTGNDSFRMHVHFGVYEVTDRNIQVSVMCDRASLAIKTIKGSYQDIIAYYDDKMRENYLKEQKYTGDFDDAISSDQFRIYLQPQISSDGNVLGAEALVRWVHPDNGLIPPGEFIPIFEKTDLICRLDIHVWELACMKLREWKLAGRTDLHISVNISPKDFYFADVYEVFTSLVARYDISPQNLKLEITETAIMSDKKGTLALVDRLRAFGFAVEIDDFGSGYSSLNMLKDMNVDILKIDMGFLRKTDNSARSKTILRTIISLSKQLGMDVVTEGVETKEQVDFLTEMGCNVFQGYYFAKPMPVSDFEDKYFIRANDSVTDE